MRENFVRKEEERNDRQAKEKEVRTLILNSLPNDNLVFEKLKLIHAHLGNGPESGSLSYENVTLEYVIGLYIALEPIETKLVQGTFSPFYPKDYEGRYSNGKVTMVAPMQVRVWKLENANSTKFSWFTMLENGLIVKVNCVTNSPTIGRFRWFKPKNGDGYYLLDGKALQFVDQKYKLIRGNSYESYAVEYYWPDYVNPVDEILEAL